MGIRSTSYYGWENIDVYGPISSNNIVSAQFNDVAVDVSGNIYTVGSYSSSLDGNHWFVRRSVDAGKNWSLIDDVHPGNRFTNVNSAVSIALDLTGGIYVLGSQNNTGDNGSTNYVRKTNLTSSTVWSQTSVSVVTKIFAGNSNLQMIVGTIARDPPPGGYWTIVTSSDYGTNWGTVDSIINTSSPANTCRDITVNSSGTFFAVGGISQSGSYTVRTSTTGLLNSWTTLNAYNPTATANPYKITCTNQDDLYVAGRASPSGSMDFIVRRSLDLGTTWEDVDIYDGGGAGETASRGDEAVGIYTDSVGNIYAAGFHTASSDDPNYGFRWLVRYSSNGSLFSHVDDYKEFNIDHKVSSIIIDQKDNIYVAGYSTNKGILRKGKLTANSASLGPRMLATSFGYVQSEISGVLTEAFNLNNISEFPHSSGLFQMPNLVLGTKTYGKAGKTDDAIVQKRFIGSFVRVLWPKQEDSDVKGYEISKQPGKLSTEWSPGEVVDIDGKGFDSLALNCVASTLVSGTMDSILVRVETRGLNSSGFMIDQTIEQTISGSYSSEAVYRDDVLRKDINYGDNSLLEIAWKIPIELKNVKEVRVSCRQKVGQSEEKNKQFLVIGRFITTDKNHGET